MKILNLIIPIFLIISMSSTSCQQIKGTIIEGSIKGAENMTVYVEQISLVSQGNNVITEKADATGNFTIKFPDGVKKGAYIVRIGEQMIDLITDGSEKKIKLSGNLQDLNQFKYTVEGAKLTESFQKGVSSFVTSQDQAALKTFTTKEADPLVGFQIAARLFTFRIEALDVHKEVAAKMKASYPDLPLTAEYQTIIGQIEQQAKMEQAAQKIQVGQPAPEIALPGPDGKIRKLSDYKGKVVLIDFWASWCGPCRKANPHVVDIYNKYKSKGFDVLSVSLDGVDSRTAQKFDEAQLKEQKQGTKERWLAAIAQDGLVWDGHVSDLKKWESAPAGEYGVRSIPQTFLVGKDGKIIAVNPRDNLEEQVSKNL